jgi:hypothetical protein
MSYALISPFKGLKDFYTSPTLLDFINVMETKKVLTSLPVVPVPSSLSIETTATVAPTVGIAVKNTFHIMLELIEEYQVDMLRKKHRRQAIE